MTADFDRSLAEANYSYTVYTVWRINE